MAPNSRARAGSGLRLAVDPAGFHFFDPETGARLGAAAAAGSQPAEAFAR